MRKVIVAGAGSVGLEVIGRIRNSVLIDADPAKVHMLGKENPDWTIVGGDARDPNVLKAAGLEDAEYLLICTGNDIYTQKIAITANEVYDEAKILAVMKDEANYEDFKDAGVDIIVSPLSETIDAVVHQLLPVGEDITEIAISQHSPAVGRKVREIMLPEDCTIGAILRGHHLLKPEPDAVLQSGDVISIVSLGLLEPDIIDAITGTHGMIVPIDHFIILLVDEEDLKVVSEVLILASKILASCHCIISDMLIPYHHDIEKKCEEIGVEVTFEPYMGNILDKFRNVVASTGPERNCVFVVPQRRISLLQYHFPASYIDSLVPISLHPFYIPRQRKFKRFKRVMHHIDGVSHSDLGASYAVGMARTNDVPLKSIVSHIAENTYSEEILIHTKRICKVYGIPVKEVIIEGNPMLEFIQAVKEEKNQLVIVNWNCTALRRDIIRKILNEGETSVLLMK